MGAYMLYNYATRQMDTLDTFPSTDEEAIRYIPQVAPAQGLYSLYREVGKSVDEAMEGVLLACVGETSSMLK